MSIDYGEIICTAVDEIVTAKLQGLQYDITKLCTVVDDAFSYQGKYVVSDGTARYEAYSTDTSFKAGNNVLVVIPNGDYNMQKTITGRVAAADTTPFNYTSPLDTMIRITNNIFDDSKTLYGDNAGLLANGNRDNINQSGSIIGPLYSITETGDFAGFTRLGITADFRTWLNGLDVTEGIYGLKVLIYTEVPNAPGSTNKNTVYELTFSSTDMVGNPYQFESFFYQEKVFDISNINNIKQIDVYFYQNDEFKSGSGDYIPWKDVNITADGTELSSNKPNNLFVDNVKIYLGYETGAFTEETLMLYTPDSLSYHYNHVDLEKNISLRWIHMIDEKNFELLDGNNLNDKYEIRWFKYHPGWEIIDQYAGKDWEEVGVVGEIRNEIVRLTKEMEYKISQISPEKSESIIEIQQEYNNKIVEQNNKIIDAKENNLFKYSFIPDLNKQTERIKAVGLIKEVNGEIETITPYYSNLLVFENEEEVPDKITVDVSTALSIECLDNTEGNYYIYNQNGKINNEGIGRGYKRYLKAMYQGAEITNSLGELEWIKWYIPVGDSTMLISTDSFRKENNGIVENDVNYKGKAYHVITRKATKNDIGKTELNVLQAYSINNQWNFKKSNNTIRCQVKIGNNIYDAVEELRFGKAGSNGTNITFLIEFEDNQNALLATQGKTVNIRARLYDSNSSRVDFSTDEAKKIKWSWYRTTTKVETGKEVDAKYINLDSNNNIAVLTSNINFIPNDNYYILKAEYGNLEAYLPIPLKTEDATLIEGAREVIYNHQGIPNYYNDAYIFYVLNKKTNQYEKTNDGTWILTHNGNLVDEKESGSTSLSESYIPRLKKVPGTDYVALSASQFYVCGENDKVCVSYTNGTYGWSQPILVMQSKYDFAMLNEWDGSLKIDEDNGTILSTMLGAGRKNDKNQFSGVLIGDIEGGTELNKTETLTGVYGLHEGVISYALKEDGTATFGKAGCGQIKIDGNKGQIFSPNYFDKNEENEEDIGEGMLIDLDDGKIHIKDNGFTKILIQPDSSNKDPYLLINGDSNATLINIEDKDYYLQSSDYYKNAGKTGTHFDLADGELIIKKPDVGEIYLSDKNGNLFKIQHRNSQPLIVMRDKEYYLQSAKYEGKTQHTIEYNNETYTLYNNTRTSLLNGEGEDKKTISITPIVAIKDNEVYQINETTLTPSKSPIDFKKTTIVRTEAKDENDASVNVVNITYEKDEYKNYFISQLSPKLINTSQSGLKMDLEQGYISGYDLRLNGINANNNSQQFILDSSAEKTPFSIGNKFKVDWDGTVYCENLKYLGTKPSDGTTVININDNFYVTSSGGAGGSSANFGKGYFGGGHFGGSAARVSLNGNASNAFATVDGSGNIYQSGYNPAKITEIINKLNLAVEAIGMLAGLQSDVSTLKQQMAGKVSSDLLSDIIGVSNRLDLVVNNYGKHYHSGKTDSSGDSFTTGKPKT